MQRRDLKLTSYADCRAELERLAGGCEPLANWTLGGTCLHLSFFVRGSLDGFGDLRISPVIQWLVGKPLLAYINWTGRMPGGLPTVPEAEPGQEIDEAAAVDELRELLDRIEGHPGPLAPSPLAGRLRPSGWEKLHVAHCQHHFGLLRPTGGD